MGRDNLSVRTGLFIGGEFVDALDGRLAWFRKGYLDAIMSMIAKLISLILLSAITARAQSPATVSTGEKHLGLRPPVHFDHPPHFHDLLPVEVFSLSRSRALHVGHPAGSALDSPFLERPTCLPHPQPGSHSDPSHLRRPIGCRWIDCRSVGCQSQLA